MNAINPYKPRFPEMYSDNRLQFLEMLRDEKTPEGTIERVLSLVDDTDYFEAPASTKYHGAFPGGLFKHSFAMAQYLLRFTKREDLSWSRHCSPVLVGLLHDYCKVWKYRIVGTHEESTEEGSKPVYTYAEGIAGFGGHGADSLCKLLLEVPLTREEALCIRWHMGAYETEKWNEFEAAIKVCPNVLWTHHADMCVSKILGY